MASTSKKLRNFVDPCPGVRRGGRDRKKDLRGVVHVRQSQRSQGDENK